MKYLILRFIRLYQILVSPIFNNCCRFHPTCSKYALEVFQKHDIFSATFYSLKRILKCNPFGSYGIDLPPEKNIIGIFRKIGK